MKVRLVCEFKENPSEIAETHKAELSMMKVAHGDPDPHKKIVRQSKQDLEAFFSKFISHDGMAVIEFDLTTQQYKIVEQF